MGLTALFFSTFVASLVATWALREIAIQKSWLAQPRDDRWHTKPTALHGGVAFYPVFLLLYLYAFFQFYPLLDSSWMEILKSDEVLRQSIALLVGSLIMFVTGWVDDIRSVKPSTKLLLQLMAASPFIVASGVISLTDMVLFDIAITYFWFVGIINAVNMLDNMDGLSAGIVSIAALFLLILMLQSSQADGSLAISVAIILIAILCGFLVFNFPPAGIFMGDSGSLSIGFIVAALSVPSELNGLVELGQSESLLSSSMVLLVPVSVLCVPILDTTLVTLTRKWRAQRASQGGRDHVSHRLVMLGFSQKNTLWILYGVGAVGGMAALIMQAFPGYSMFVFGGFMLGLVFFGVYLGQVKLTPASEGESRASWVPLISELLYRQRAAEIFLDLILIIGCYYAANLLRFGGDISDHLHGLIAESVPVVVAATLLAFVIAGIYRTHWRMISLPDLTRYFAGVGGGVVLSLFGVVMLNRFATGQSRSAFVIYGILLFLAIVATRISFRMFDQFVYRNREQSAVSGLTPVLIYGAGHAGKLLANEISHNHLYGEYFVQGFLDDDSNKDGKVLAGKKIKSPDKWSVYLKDTSVEIWISTNQVSDVQVREQLGEQQVMRRFNLNVMPVN